MQTRTLTDIVREEPFFQGLSPEHIATIGACATQVRFRAGEIVFREGEDADQFYLIRSGKIALQIHRVEHGGHLIESLHQGDIVGFSWLFPPYRWVFDGIAVAETTAVRFDGSCIRGKCDADPALGYELMQRFGAIMIRRLQSTRLRLIDMYR